MFNRETENNIIDCIKKSPIGVTSSEIAKSIGLNRMTMIKYLAIIKEKALIDFKQFGMAKLWYIPVNLSKESFLSKTIHLFVVNMSKEELKSLSEKAGIGIGEEINQMYLGFYDTKKLSLTQLVEIYADIGKKLGGSFKPTLHQKKISIEVIKNPFEDSMEIILSALFAKLASLNLGYARSLIVEPEREGNIVIDVYLEKAEKQLTNYKN